MYGYVPFLEASTGMNEWCFRNDCFLSGYVFSHILLLAKKYGTFFAFDIWNSRIVLSGIWN